jgi:hypothetical protein
MERLGAGGERRRGNRGTGIAEALVKEPPSVDCPSLRCPSVDGPSLRPSVNVDSFCHMKLHSSTFTQNANARDHGLQA